MTTTRHAIKKPLIKVWPNTNPHLSIVLFVLWNNEITLRRHSIIGWRMEEGDEYADPITYTDLQISNGTSAIETRHADGATTYEWPGEECADDLSTATSTARERLLRRQEREQSRRATALAQQEAGSR
jgi:hypothetical protein